MYLFQLLEEPCSSLNTVGLNINVFSVISINDNTNLAMNIIDIWTNMQCYCLLPLATVWTRRPACRARPLRAAKEGSRKREEDEHRVIKQSQLGVPLRQKACLFAAAVALWHSSVIIPPCLDNIMKWRARHRRLPAFKFQVRCKQAWGQKPCTAGALKLFFCLFFFYFFSCYFSAMQSKHNVCNNGTLFK